MPRSVNHVASRVNAENLKEPEATGAVIKMFDSSKIVGKRSTSCDRTRKEVSGLYGLSVLMQV